MRQSVRMVLVTAAVIAGLSLPGQALADDRDQRLATTLSGAEECTDAPVVCGVGDPDGSGTAKLWLDPDEGEVCFVLRVRRIPLPAGSAGVHIHAAPAGSNGPVVVALLAAGEPTSRRERGCVSADPALIRAILANPAQYYVNVHTTQFPAGAIRGQLG